MTRTAATLVTAFAVVLGSLVAALPAQAQRAFVSGSGSDSNPCTCTQPCRTFQQAFNTVFPGGEIDVLDPAGYGPLTITHAISIQGHGIASISAAADGEDAIDIKAGGLDAVLLNGLLIDGAGTGFDGIAIGQVGSVQILNCVVRHFFDDGIRLFSAEAPPPSLLVADTIVSDTAGYGISIAPQNGNNLQTTFAPVTLNRVTVNNNIIGVGAINAYVMIANSVFSNNQTGIASQTAADIWVSNSVVSGSKYAFAIDDDGGPINSYGTNFVHANTNELQEGSLSSAATR
jgi:hypothetical protein